MKKYICIILLLFATKTLMAQGHNVFGTLVKQGTNDTLPYGYLKLQNTVTKEVMNSSSNEDGFFIFKEVDSGTYLLDVSYMGFKPYQRQIVVGNKDYMVGTIALEYTMNTTSLVTVKAKQKQITMLGDTTQFNSSSFKTNKDANAEDLVQKMPGVEVQDGELQAQGEKVTKVLVDGKPFFSDDPNAALKNLPADIISKVQIYDKESDDNEATGISTGNTEKTINIILKKEFQNGSFGNVYGGYGLEDKYSAGGNINNFNGDRRITVVGQTNNINIQNFSSSDLLGVTATVQQGNGRGRGGRRRGNSFGGNTSDFMVATQGGINTTNALGVNYQDKWGKKTEVVGSYFFNQTDNKNEVFESEDYFNTSYPLLYENTENTTAMNLNHRLNLQLKHTFNKNNTLLIKPSLTIQENNGNTDATSFTFTDDTMSNSLVQNSNSDLGALSFSNKMIYTKMFEKKGRRFNIIFNNGVETSDGNKLLNSTNIGSSGTTVLDQLSNLDNKETSWEGALSFMEPITETTALYTKLEYGQANSNFEVFTNDYDAGTEEYTNLNSDLSNVFKGTTATSLAEVGLRYKGKKLMGMIRGAYQVVERENKQEYPFENIVNNTFKNFMPMAFGRYQFNKNQNLRMFYRTHTSLPSVSDLQEVADVSNPLQITIGNPELKQQLNHSLGMRYTSNNTKKNSIFHASLNVSLADDYNGDQIRFANSGDSLAGLELSEGTQITTPVNLSGYQSHRLYISYGIPSELLKSNVNLSASTSYSAIPSIVDDTKFMTESENIRLRASLSSNVSENIDFTVSTSSNFDYAQSELSGNTNYFSQSSDISMVYSFLESWKFTTSATHQYYKGLDDGIDNDYMLWNAGIGKKFLKGDKGELSLNIYDILNTNTAISQSYTETAYVQSQSLALTRFFMVKFTYKIQHFKAAKTKD